MTETFGLADLLAAIEYSGHNPSWSEYKAASPCEQRAIIARWAELRASNPVFGTPEFSEMNIAAGRMDRAATENAIRKSAKPNDTERHIVEMDSDMGEAREKNWNI